MKTCRYCQHTQEDGDYCESCGFPFSADKLDFSSEDITPDITNMNSAPASSDAQDLSGATPAETSVVAPVVAPVVPAQTEAAQTEAAPAETTPAETSESPVQETTSDSSDEVATDVPAAEADEDGDADKRIIYSAAATGKSVYDPKLLRHVSSSGKTTFSSKANPGASVEDGGDPEKKIDSLATTALVVNSACILCTCGFNLVGLILAIIAYVKAKRVKEGKSKTPNADLERARGFAIASFIVMGLVVFFLGLAIMIA